MPFRLVPVMRRPQLPAGRDGSIPRGALQRQLTLRPEGAGVHRAEKGCRLGLGRCLELDHELGGDPAAVLYLDALRLGPLADLGRVDPVRGRLAAGARRPPGIAADSAGRAYVAGECVAKCLGMAGVQVDLVVGAVEAEANRPSAALPSMSSMSSMNRVCIFCATAAPFPAWTDINVTSTGSTITQTHRQRSATMYKYSLAVRSQTGPGLPGRSRRGMRLRGS